jgi:hypothetical protein
MSFGVPWVRCRRFSAGSSRRPSAGSFADWQDWHGVYLLDTNIVSAALVNIDELSVLDASQWCVSSCRRRNAVRRCIEAGVCASAATVEAFLAAATLTLGRQSCRSAWGGSQEEVGWYADRRFRRDDRSMHCDQGGAGHRQRQAFARVGGCPRELCAPTTCGILSRALARWLQSRSEGTSRTLQAPAPRALPALRREKFFFDLSRTNFIAFRSAFASGRWWIGKLFSVFCSLPARRCGGQASSSRCSCRTA